MAMNVENIIADAGSMPPAPPLRAGSVPPDLDTYEDAEDPRVKGSTWRIETIQSADWALARMAELQAEAESIDALAKAAKERIEKRAELLKARVARGLDYFRYKLLEYAVTHRTAILGGSKKKSRAFIHGTIGWRKVGGRLYVTDPDALRAWLSTQTVESGLYRMKIEPEMAEIQRRFKEDGVIPPGMNMESEGEDPYVKVEPPETALAKE